MSAGPASASTLKRSLTLRHLVVYGLVFISPTAPFAFFGILFNTSHGMVSLAYLMGAIAILFTALSYQEMAARFPVAGSVYVYASRAIGPVTGFIAGWALLLDYLLLPSVIYITSAVAVHAAMPAVPQYVVILVLLAFSTGLNLLRIAVTMRANFALLAVQLAILFVFFALAAYAIVVPESSTHLKFGAFYNPSAFELPALVEATSLVVLSFLGFDALALLAEEVKGGRRVVGIGMVVALVICTVLFMAQGYVATLFAAGRTAFPAGDPTYAAFYDICAIIGGRQFLLLVSFPGVMLQGMASGIACQAATARLLYGMAREGVLPSPLARVNAKTGTPDIATIVVGLLSAALSLFFVAKLELLTSMVSCGALVGFMLLHASVLALFTRSPSDSLWLRYFLVPLLGILIVAYVLANVPNNAKLLGSAWLGLGFVAHQVARNRRAS